MLTKATAYVKSYDGKTKWMYFLIEDIDLLKKYDTVWDEFSDEIKKDLIANLCIIKTIWKPK